MIQLTPEIQVSECCMHELSEVIANDGSSKPEEILPALLPKVVDTLTRSLLWKRSDWAREQPFHEEPAFMVRHAKQETLEYFRLYKPAVTLEPTDNGWTMWSPTERRVDPGYYVTRMLEEFRIEKGLLK